MKLTVRLKKGQKELRTAIRELALAQKRTDKALADLAASNGHKKR